LKCVDKVILINTVEELQRYQQKWRNYLERMESDRFLIQLTFCY